MLRSLVQLRVLTGSLAPTRHICSGAGVAGRRVPLTFRMKPAQLDLGGSSVAPGGGGGRGHGGRRLCATGGSDGGGSSGSGGNGLWAKYTELLEKAPFVTRALTCGVLNLVGDIFCQLFVEKAGSFDLKRGALFFVIGTAYVGPVLYNWYGFLGKLIPGSSLGAVAGSLVMDQLVFAPVFVGSFIALFTVINGGGVDAVKSKLQAEWMNAVKVNWGIWVPAQFINFRFVPPQFRVLATNITALVWNTYISYATYKTSA
uniref:Peroxisomal membrane protein MPV17 n=1 Tax=Chlamydomonas euryale TaxID=1486919 RepID=A0A7R9V7K2_9CHLO|mmetsp:Transcript_24235/g.71958  ORF Transcript_24235/g.71958 Transcript_24235/m.71958 type:complete len:258 (+) Transcript_24235:125-898(+)